MTWVKWVETANLYKYSFSDDITKVSVIITNNGSNKTSDIENLEEDTYIDYNDTFGTYSILTDADMTSLWLSGNFDADGDSWGSGQAFSKVGDSELEWTTTLDVSGTTKDIVFKIRPNTSESVWLGAQSSVEIDAPEGWIVDDGSDDHNYKLRNSIAGYNTYKLTATWVKNPYISENWTLKIEGDEARTYSIVGLETSGEGEGWSIDRDMTATGTEGEYQVVVDDFTVPTAGTYLYKLRTNHAWSGYELPASGNNSYTFNDSGKYRLTFMANVSENTLSLSAEKIVELGTSGKGTFASNHVCDFSGVEGLTAYAVSEISGDYAMLTKVTGVPNGNGVILAGSANGKYYVPFGSAESLGSDNLLQAVTAAAGHTVENNGDAYILYTDGLFHPANAGTIPFGKAYLNKAAVGSARALSLVFDGEDITGISNIENNATANDGFYNLAGQRVAAPAKGLYIVNGKKVIIK